MVNSGMINIAVVTKNNYHSLMDHLGSGKAWNLSRKKYGLYLFPPYSSVDSAGHDNRIDSLYSLLSYLKHSSQQYVILSESNIVINTTFTNAFKHHVESRADITVIYEQLKDLENILNCWIKNVHIDIDISKAIPPIDNAHLGKYFNIASKTFDAGFYISLVVVGSIFLSFDYQNFKKGIKSFLPTKHKEKIERYFMEFLPFIHKYVKGIFIDSLVVFAMGLITFFVFGYKNAIFFAILLGISNCIPLFGPYISGIPIVLISFLTSTQSGITALIIIVVIQVIDGNIIQPLIMKNILYLHPLENVLGISVLTTLFGLIGMILSPIVVTSIKILSKHIRLNKDERKKELEEFKKINKNPLN